jgi:hypothetical protein
MNSSDVAAGQHGYATQYNNLRKDVKNGIRDITSNTDAATVTFDLTASNVHTVSLGGNRTLDISTPTVGQAFLVRIAQTTGSNTVTWWSTIKWPGGAAPTLSTAAGAVDAFVIICTGSGTYDGYFAGFGLA